MNRTKRKYLSFTSIIFRKKHRYVQSQLKKITLPSSKQTQKTKTKGKSCSFLFTCVWVDDNFYMLTKYMFVSKDRQRETDSPRKY